MRHTTLVLMAACLVGLLPGCGVPASTHAPAATPFALAPVKKRIDLNLTDHRRLADAIRQYKPASEPYRYDSIAVTDRSPVGLRFSARETRWLPDGKKEQADVSGYYNSELGKVIYLDTVRNLDIPDDPVLVRQEVARQLAHHAAADGWSYTLDAITPPQPGLGTYTVRVTKHLTSFSGENRGALFYTGTFNRVTGRLTLSGDPVFDPWAKPKRRGLKP